MKTLQQLAEQALHVQDACNMLGVSKGFATAIQDLADTLRAEGQPCGTDDINKHPITRVWVDKLSSLCSNQFASMTDLCEQLSIVQQMAEHPDLHKHFDYTRPTKG